MIGTLKFTSYKNLNLAKLACPKWVDPDLWVYVTWFLYIPVGFLDINTHIKFLIDTMIGTLKSTAYKNLNMSLTGSCTYVRNNV